jgi:hypothetical protein
MIVGAETVPKVAIRVEGVIEALLSLGIHEAILEVGVAWQGESDGPQPELELFHRDGMVLPLVAVVDQVRGSFALPEEGGGVALDEGIAFFAGAFKKRVHGDSRDIHHRDAECTEKSLLQRNSPQTQSAQRRAKG